MKNISKFLLALILTLSIVSVFAQEIGVEEKMCTMEYAPVCAEVEVQCIQAPCPPIQETFWNRCEMENNSLAKFLHDWVCEADKETEENNESEEEALICTMEYAPVCWVGGITYGNKCQAWKNEIAYVWECKKEDETKSIKISKETDLVIANLEFPLVDNKKIDDTVYNYVENYLDKFLLEVPTEKLSDNLKYEIRINWEFNKVWIVTTYKLTIYTFTWWAHGNTEIKTFNFKKDWTEIIFKNINTLKKVSDFALNYFNELLSKSEIASDSDWLKKWLSADFNNYSSWLITELDKDTLKINFIFPQYQLAPYVEWIKSLEIDLTQLK